MRTTLFALVLLVACSSKKTQPQQTGPDTPRPMADAAPHTDAPAFAACTPTSGTTMSVTKVAQLTGADPAATLATSPPGDGRLFVVGRAGQLWIIDNTGTLLPDPFLDVSSLIVSGGELGLLGLAFHPQYAYNNTFFIWYTANNPDGTDTAHPYVDVLTRYTAMATNLNKADPASGMIILSIPDPFSNHNGGMLNFGPDGFLYVGTGDGGNAGDSPYANAQNVNALLGKILRLDIDHPGTGKMYGIPPTNPYAAGGGAPEVFMLGLRNPWRWSFDSTNGDMWIADVGQGAVEEVDHLTPAQQNGQNMGWNVFEGNTCYGGNPACATLTTTFVPQYTYTHTGAFNCIVGGAVYRGSCFPDIVGEFFFSDNGAGGMSKAHLESDGSLTVVRLPDPAGGAWPASPSSIHADARGELYETDTAGEIFHLVAGP